MATDNIIEMRGIVKHFGSIKANDGVDFDVRKGEILCLLGENGSGKTTLMNVLLGIYFPDAGKISVNGREVFIRSPKDAYDLSIGMVHQHFKLVDVLTAAENIILGLPGKQLLNMKAAEADIRKIVDRYGFDIDLGQKIYEMSVSQKQTVEIVKMLYRGASILILDEPTAVLTPQETQKLFAVLRSMRDQGHSIIIITHKLHEVLELSDRVVVLRKGKNAGAVKTSEATELSLSELMVGDHVYLNIDRPEPVNPTPRLKLENLTCTVSDGRKRLNGASVTAMSGEILGVAGIAGSGQKELLEAISGLRPLADGRVTYIDPQTGDDKVISGMSVSEIRRLGIRYAYVPEDRLGMGLVASMGMTDNMMLRSYGNGHSIFSDRKKPRSLAKRIINDLQVVTPGTEWPVGRMSGGNVQKVLLGREIASLPKVLMVAYPVRGLDVNASHMVYKLLNEQKQNGTAVIYVGEDLDVLLALCDRIMVLCGGEVTGVVDARTVTKEQIGLMMTGKKLEEADA